MIDTIYPRHDSNFLITRFLSVGLKKWTVLDGDKIIFKDLIKASWSDFALQVLSIVPTARPLAILHALRANGNGHELKQYVIWQPQDKTFTAATLLKGDEEFYLNEVKR